MTAGSAARRQAGRSRHMGAARAAMFAAPFGVFLATQAANAAPIFTPAGPLTGSFSLRVITTHEQKIFNASGNGPYASSLDATEITPIFTNTTVTEQATAEGFAGRPALDPLQQNLSIGLKSFASVAVRSGDYIGSVSGGAQAEARSQLFVPFMVTGLPTGTTGTMTLRLKLDGDIAVGPFIGGSNGTQKSGYAEMYFWATGLNVIDLCPYYGNAACWALYRAAPTDVLRFNNPNQVWDLAIPFSAGIVGSFNMQLRSAANASATAWVNAGGAADVDNVSKSDYLHTAALDGIVDLRDSSGNLLTGWTVTTAEGFDLNARAAADPLSVAAPVPQAALLLGLGLLWRTARRGRAA